MAMIKCPECGQEISDKAKRCIHCGYYMKSRNRIRLGIITTTIIVIIIGTIVIHFNINNNNSNMGFNEEKYINSKNIDKHYLNEGYFVIDTQDGNIIGVGNNTESIIDTEEYEELNGKYYAPSSIVNYYEFKPADDKSGNVSWHFIFSDGDEQIEDAVYVIKDNIVTIKFSEDNTTEFILYKDCLLSVKFESYGEIGDKDTLKSYNSNTGVLHNFNINFEEDGTVYINKEKCSYYRNGDFIYIDGYPNIQKLLIYNGKITSGMFQKKQ